MRQKGIRKFDAFGVCAWAFRKFISLPLMVDARASQALKMAHICPILLRKAKINTKGEQLQEPLPRLIRDDTGEEKTSGKQLGLLWRSSCPNLVCQCKWRGDLLLLRRGLVALRRDPSIESQARREGYEDRWLGLWTQQKPPLILLWVSICFASLPKAITQLPFFLRPFLWRPRAFLPCQSFLSPAMKSGL